MVYEILSRLDAHDYVEARDSRFPALQYQNDTKGGEE